VKSSVYDYFFKEKDIKQLKELAKTQTASKLQPDGEDGEEAEEDPTPPQPDVEMEEEVVTTKKDKGKIPSAPSKLKQKGVVILHIHGGGFVAMSSSSH